MPFMEAQLRAIPWHLREKCCSRRPLFMENVGKSENHFVILAIGVEVIRALN